MKYLICNLKEEKTLLEIIEYKKALAHVMHPNTELILCPSYPYIPILHCDNYKIGAQNVSKYETGKFTGEVSIRTLLSLDVKYVIIGHSELQNNETEEDILNKINMALKYKIKPIYIIGENEELYKHKESIKYIQQKIDALLININHELIDQMIIAYEPPWMINTEKNINIKYIEEITNFIKIYIKERTLKKVAVIYGGSVNELNISMLQNIDIDGLLMGKYAQNPANIKKMLT